jgi:hypothetical protein
VVQALIGSQKAAKAESNSTLHQSGTDEVPLESPMCGQLPCLFGPCISFDEITEPNRAFDEEGGSYAFLLELASFY